jgi:hypothetical protein
MAGTGRVHRKQFVQLRRDSEDSFKHSLRGVMPLVTQVTIVGPPELDIPRFEEPPANFVETLSKSGKFAPIKNVSHLKWWAPVVKFVGVIWTARWVPIGGFCGMFFIDHRKCPKSGLDNISVCQCLTGMLCRSCTQGTKTPLNVRRNRRVSEVFVEEKKKTLSKDELKTVRTTHHHYPADPVSTAPCNTCHPRKRRQAKRLPLVVERRPASPASLSPPLWPGVLQVAVFVPSVVLELVMRGEEYQPFSVDIPDAAVVLVDLSGAIKTSLARCTCEAVM